MTVVPSLSMNAMAAARPRVQTVVSASTVTPNASDDDVVEITEQNVALTIANPIDPSGTMSNCQRLLIIYKDNGVSRTITWGSEYRSFGATLPTATTAGKKSKSIFVKDTPDNKWDLLSTATLP